MKDKMIVLTEAELFNIIKRTAIRAINEISDETQQSVYNKRRDNVLRADKKYRDKQEEIDTLRRETGQLYAKKHDLDKAGPHANAKGLFKNLPGNKRKRQEEYDREMDDIDTRIEQKSKELKDAQEDAARLGADAGIAFDKYYKSYVNNKYNSNSKVNIDSYPKYDYVLRDHNSTKSNNPYHFNYDNKNSRLEQKKRERQESRKQRQQQELDDYINNLD